MTKDNVILPRLSNPLLGISVPVPFDAVRAEHIQPAIEKLLADAKERLDAIGRGGADAARARTYDSTLGALDLATNELDYAMNVAGHLEAVIGSRELREAYNQVLPPVSAFYSEILLSEPLYRALREFAATDEARSLERTGGAPARYLKKTLDDFRRNGAELDAAGKKRLAEIDVALSEKTLKFAQNVVDATASFELVFEDASRLAGLPEGAIEAAKKSAEEKGKKGYRLTLQAPSYGPAMTFANDRGVREALYRANVTRAAKENPPLIREVLELRREKAKLLGFSHFADLVTDDRMAKSGKKALEFVTMLRDRLVPHFERENRELEAFAKNNGHVGALEAWDVTYWAERQRRERYDLDEETLRPYFPLDRVTRGLFEIATALYGIRIERDTAARVWHPDVTAWAVFDDQGTRLGGFYLDLFPRDTKRDGAWMGGVVDRLPGTKHALENIAVIVGNMTPPRRAGQPALLNHREVETLFHEFGHMMHHVLSDVPIRSLAGTRVVSDFVELPSMVMENWCWEPAALDRFACHYETGKPIPDDIKQRMLKARTYRAANALMRQLGFSTVDLSLHTEYDPAKHGDVMGYARDVFARFSPTPLPAEYAMLASFSHLFGSSYGYAAGYYSYQWSEVLEADAFSRFKMEGILSPTAGDAFRKEILARGDTEDPAVLYRNFLGRDPEVNALMTRLGFGDASSAAV